MKTKIIFLTLLCIPYLGYSQVTKSDLVIRNNGDSLSVKISKVGENNITYSFPDETITYKLSKNLIKEIQFGTGRVEKINSVVIINGE